MGAVRVGPTVGFFAYALRQRGWRIECLREVIELSDGSVLNLPGAPEVIGLPGHWPAAAVRAAAAS